MSSIHDVNLVMYVRWVESLNDAKFIVSGFIYWFPNALVWRSPNGAWWIQPDGQKEVMHILWSLVGCHLHVLLQRWKVLLFFDWLSHCAHVLVALCEADIVLQCKSINLFRDAVTGPILSLTTSHVHSSCSLDFGISIQWSGCRKCFWLCLLLLLTLCLCKFLFHTQFMILMWSYYRVSSLAIASVDGCCLYIIIHNSMSYRSWL